jgi:hypothetical protein
VNRSHPDLFHAGHRRLPNASYRNEPTATLTLRLQSGAATRQCLR